ncbi:hypothetical protein Nizo2535_2152 [Lactiplantibacillus plantarum]|nr:CpsB/CapC family capsule biosynthesis tyrosine phosphatase [Lactiplantibacillus plantarum]KZU29553.1 hypothetical protein Nizo2535_2152 [Lactiplantibacillus plantarum]KZU74262.1 hypothetical protein Nizo2891_3312 [Lactiplantibacillus plantarum]
MIDLHCHILPGCDDGAHTMADDYIYLLAAIASVADSVARPYETHQIN